MKVLLILSTCSCTGQEKAQLEHRKPPVSIQVADSPPEKRGLDPQGQKETPPVGDPQGQKEFLINGQVSAIRNSKIGFRGAGFILTMNVKAGAFVKKGDILGSLDDRDVVLRLSLAKARRDQAKIAYDAAEKEFEREKQLKTAKASTETVYDRMKSNFEEAAVSVKLSQLDVAMAELALQDTKLVAPYDCVVANQMKFDGEYVASGNAVYEVYDTSEPEVTLTAPERLMSTLVVGTDLTVKIPSISYSSPGKIIRVVPVISEKTRTFQITAKLSQYNTKIIPGLYTEATVIN